MQATLLRLGGRDSGKDFCHDHKQLQVTTQLHAAELNLSANSARCGISLNGMDAVNAFVHVPGLTAAPNMTVQPHCAAPYALPFVQLSMCAWMHSMSLQEDPEWTAEKELCMRKGLPYVPPKKKVVAQATPALLSYSQSRATLTCHRICTHKICS